MKRYMVRGVDALVNEPDREIEAWGPEEAAEIYMQHCQDRHAVLDRFNVQVLVGNCWWRMELEATEVIWNAWRVVSC